MRDKLQKDSEARKSWKNRFRPPTEHVFAPQKRSANDDGKRDSRVFENAVALFHTNGEHAGVESVAMEAAAATPEQIYAFFGAATPNELPDAIILAILNVTELQKNELSTRKLFVDQAIEALCLRHCGAHCPDANTCRGWIKLRGYL